MRGMGDHRRQSSVFERILLPYPPFSLSVLTLASLRLSSLTCNRRAMKTFGLFLSPPLPLPPLPPPPVVPPIALNPPAPTLAESSRTPPCPFLDTDRSSYTTISSTSKMAAARAISPTCANA